MEFVQSNLHFRSKFLNINTFFSSAQILKHMSISNNICKKSYPRYTYGKAVLGSVRMNLAVLDDAGKAERFSTSIHTVLTLMIL